MMKWAIVLCLMTITLTSFKTEVDEGVLANGRYKVDFTSKEIADYEIEIKGSEYIKHLPSQNKVGTIIQVEPGLFIFKDKADSTSEAKDEIIRQIRGAFGEECMEVKTVRGNKIGFRTTYEANLHITLNEGMLIKKRGK
jgi:hypothetical protein